MSGWRKGEGKEWMKVPCMILDFINKRCPCNKSNNRNMITLDPSSVSRTDQTVTNHNNPTFQQRWPLLIRLISPSSEKVSSYSLLLSLRGFWTFATLQHCKSTTSFPVKCFDSFFIQRLHVTIYSSVSETTIIIPERRKERMIWQVKGIFRSILLSHPIPFKREGRGDTGVAPSSCQLHTDVSVVSRKRMIH